jgi:glutathione synthase
MRKDPPFDMEYVYSTYLLEAAEAQGARVFNRPRAIRDYNEKMAIAKFREYMHDHARVARHGAHRAFIDEMRDASSSRSTAWAARRSSACAKAIPTAT